MSPEKSNFGMLPAPSSLTDAITQDGKLLTIARTRDGQNVTLKIPLDGSTMDATIRGQASKVTAHWEGPVLVVNYSGNRNGNGFSSEERWTMQPNGKSFEVKRHLKGARGESDQTVFLVKQ